MLKRLIALSLSVLLLAGVFAGCAPAQSPDTGDNPSGNEGEGSGTQEPTKVHYLHWLTPEDLPGDQAVLQKIIEETGIEPICITPAGGSQSEKLNILMASNEPLDLINGNWPDMQRTGSIIPLNDLLEQEGQALVDSFTENEWATRTDKDGKIWGIPISNYANGSGVRIRQDWLDQVGLPVPTTLEEFEAVLEAFKNEESFGKDRIVLATSWQVSQLERSFAGMWCDSGTEDFLDTDGKVKPAVFNPGYRDFVAKMAEWYQKGYFWKEGFVQQYTVINDIVAQNRVGILATWSSTGIDGYIQLLDAGEDVKYVFADKLSGPAGTAYTLLRPGVDAFMITSKSKVPEETMRLINWYNDDIDDKMLVNHGIEGVNWKWVDKEKQVFEKLEVSSDQEVTGKYNYVQGGLHLSAWANDNWSKAWLECFNFGTDPNVDLKIPFDLSISYDTAKIQSAVPTYSDLEKYRDESIIKFITGQRDLGEWDAFLEEMLNLGWAKTIEEKTAQYQAAQ